MAFSKKILPQSGADLGLSQTGGGGGGGGLRRGVCRFSKKCVDLFYDDFSSSPEALVCPCFGHILCAAGKILKKKQASKKRF